MAGPAVSDLPYIKEIDEKVTLLYLYTQHRNFRRSSSRSNL